MTAIPQPPARFVAAPVVDGVAAWSQATELEVTPLRLASPVPLALAYRQRHVAGAR